MTTPTTPATAADLARYRRFLNEEVDGLYIYRQLAEIEADAQLKDVYARLAETEVRHLELWQRQLREAHRLYVEMGATGHAERISRQLAAVSAPPEETLSE